jgi:hypothetical protein
MVRVLKFARGVTPHAHVLLEARRAQLSLPAPMRKYVLFERCPSLFCTLLGSVANSESGDATVCVPGGS